MQNLSNTQKLNQTKRTLNQSDQYSKKIIQNQQQFISKFDKLKKQMIDELNQVWCCQKQLVKFVCTQKKCEGMNKLMCSDQECKCNMLHKKCSMIKTKYFHQGIVDKLIDTEQLVTKVDSIFDNIIDMISECRIKTIRYLKERFGLTEFSLLQYEVYQVHYGKGCKLI